MDVNSHKTISIGASTIFNMSNKTPNNNLNSVLTVIPTIDETEADVLNDETFGDCDLEAIKMKSDFGENGEFLGDYPSEQLPDFFNTDIPDKGGGIPLIDNDDDDQSQQPSIDALLAEDLMPMSGLSINLRSSTINPLFNMAISQANNTNLFSQPPMTLPAPPPPPPPPPPIPTQQAQLNFELLKQFEQMLISRQVPAHERIIYIQALIEKMQRDVLNMQQQTARLTNLNTNGHDRSKDINSNRTLDNNLVYNQHESTRPMVIGEMMERARLTAMNMNNSRSQSPATASSGISSQFMDAIQRSDQIPIVDNQQNRINQSVPPPSSSPLDTVGSLSPHHHNHSRQNRPAKHYPRPPLLNTWQGRGPGHDEFAGMMNDREKQWVVKIQLHQASQTAEEDFYYNKWLQQKRAHGNNQSNRHGHRGQKISYPVLQLLKSIQQENELAQRLSQTSTQATFSNVNPSQPLPYALPIPTTQLGKQSVTTPRHPRCTLHLDGGFSLGRRTNSITHDKYTLGILLNIENIYRDILRLDINHDNEKSNQINNTESSEITNQSKQILNSIIDRYLNDQNYLFADMFGQSKKGQIILYRLYQFIKNTDDFEIILSHLYGSLSYLTHQYSTTFHIEPMVMNTIHLMQQQITGKKSTLEQFLSQIYTYYNEKIKGKLTKIHPTASSSPFSDPVLFTNSSTVTILIDLLLNLERHCYLLPDANTSKLPIQILQQLQPHLQYQLSEQVRLIVTDLCQAILECSSPVYTLKKTHRPFAQTNHQQFSLLCKFIRIQVSQQIYASLEPKLIYCCIKDN